MDEALPHYMVMVATEDAIEDQVMQLILETRKYRIFIDLERQRHLVIGIRDSEQGSTRDFWRSTTQDNTETPTFESRRRAMENSLKQRVTNLG
jgi:hypothetical protein